ncbi:MAG: YicC family protein [Planctomycetota bacterium]|nr:YicC family protein [Planctomycetota bacterium]MDA1214236.1 YicC family protein [Planctomycetota bacterium]
MTGFGTAREQSGDRCVIIEVRTVNNRYLKISTRCPDHFAVFENQIEKVIREFVSRGTVNVSIRSELLGLTGAFRLHPDTISEYWRQLQEIAHSLKITDLTSGRDLSQLALLPGAVTDKSTDDISLEEIWPTCELALRSAMTQLQAFRQREGQSTADDLRSSCAVIAGHIEQIVAKSATIVSDYRNRMLDRVNEMLKEFPVKVSETDIIREVSLFADRCDINEELSRLRCHLQKFESFLNDKESQGRKIDFLSQEIFREINTIGSKANDVTISYSVVEMKAALERIRENVQNVE